MQLAAVVGEAVVGINSNPSKDSGVTEGGHKEPHT